MQQAVIAVGCAECNFTSLDYGDTQAAQSQIKRSRGIQWILRR
jgi:hypothetical protein